MLCGRKFLVFLALLAQFVAAPLSAIELSPAPFVRGLPDNLRGPLTKFLEQMGWKSGESFLASTTLAPVKHDSFHIIRFEDARLCSPEKDNCLIVIGSVREGRFVADVMFLGGSKMNIGDHIRPLAESDGPNVLEFRFFGKTQNVVAFPTPSGWIAVPSPMSSKDREILFPEEKRN